jgi:CRISPR-associated protein Cas2
MYVIITYDVNQKRVAKVHKLLKQYLIWIQNSVFEGEIAEGKLKKLKKDINKIIKKEEDSVIYFQTYNNKYLKKQVTGNKEIDFTNFL